MCCSVLQCVAVCCSVLQSYVVRSALPVRCSVLQCVVGCCNVLQPEFTEESESLQRRSGCRVMQRGAVWCNVVERGAVVQHQCVAVCCSVF